MVEREPEVEIPPLLAAQDIEMPPGGNDLPQIQDQENEINDPGTPNESDEDDEDGEVEDSDDSDDGETFPSCFPRNPPDVERIPFVEYPADAVRSSPSDRNRDFARRVQENFVPYQKGMKGESYRKRTNYEHQLAMG